MTDATAGRMHDAAVDPGSMIDPLVRFNVICDRAIHMLDLLLGQLGSPFGDVARPAR